MPDEREMPSGVRLELRRAAQINLETAAPLSADRDPWERQPKETPIQYGHFCVYRDLGSLRTLKKAAKVAGRSMSVLAALSQKYRWRERIEAWDRHLDRVAQQEHEQIIRDAKRRHLDLAQRMQETLQEALPTFKPGEMTEKDFATWFATAVKIERLSLGLPTEQVNVNYMTWEDVERFSAALSHLVISLADYVDEEHREAYQNEIQQGIQGLLRGDGPGRHAALGIGQNGDEPQV